MKLFALPILFFLFSLPILTDLPLQEVEREVESSTSQEEVEEITDLLLPDVVKDFDMPVVLNDAVEYYIAYFTTEKREVFSRWLRRARSYVPAMKEVLRQEGLPEDLVYLAMVESGFNPKAYSPKKACGPWQFIMETGKRYGLKVDYFRDERRDFEKSTLAAARYLKDLYDQFGCWFLAQAAYNAGEKKLQRAIRRHDTEDFWELSAYGALPAETRAFVPKIIAAAIIAKNPERFGFEKIEYEEPIGFKKVKVKGGLPLKMIAKAAGIDALELRKLNPEILRGITPPSEESYAIRLPHSIEEEAFEKRLNSLLKESKVYSNLRPHRLRKKESLASLLKTHGATYEDLAIVNGIEGCFRPKAGSLIYIPVFDKGKAIGKKAEGLKTASYRRKVPYRGAKKGKVFSSRAQGYGSGLEGVRPQSRIMDREKGQEGLRVRTKRK